MKVNLNYALILGSYQGQQNELPCMMIYNMDTPNVAPILGPSLAGGFL